MESEISNDTPHKRYPHKPPAQGTEPPKKTFDLIAGALRPYAETAISTSIPAILGGLALRSTGVVGLGVGLLATTCIAFPATSSRAFRRLLLKMINASLKALTLLAKIAVLGLATSIVLAGVTLFVRSDGDLFLVTVGAATAVIGATLTRMSLELFQPRPKPVPQLPAPSIPKSVVKAPIVTPPKPAPAAKVEPPKPISPPKPRQTVLLGHRQFPAEETDQRNYCFIGPPGCGKSTLLQLFCLPVIEEILQPGSDSRLILFDPKREFWAWIASKWPEKTHAVLRYFCFNDQRTNIPDLNFDYRTQNDALTLSHAFFPENPNEHQPFFPESLRTLVAAAIFAIKKKLGYWNLRILMLVLSNPGYLRHLVGSEPCTKFAKELLSTRSEETAQNVQMTITSKLLRFRILAAHFARVHKSDVLSLDRLLEKSGVLVISRDRKYHVAQDGMNAVIMERLGQILEQKHADPLNTSKTYIFIDEFPTLAGDKPCPGLIDMFLRLRSLGVVFLITFQTYASVKRVYGERADEFMNTCRNFIIVGSGDPTDAKHSVELIGKMRGYEPQRSNSTTEGTNENDTAGTSDTRGQSYSKTRHAGVLNWDVSPPSWLSGSNIPGGFTPTDTSGTSTSHTTQNSRTSGRSKSTTSSETWVWYDRDILSPTDLMRWPLPTKEKGIVAMAYRAGEPAAWLFNYTWDFIDKHVHRRNRFIRQTIDRHDHEEILEEWTPEEFFSLGLEEVAAKDPSLWPTTEAFAEFWEDVDALKKADA